MRLLDIIVNIVITKQKLNPIFSGMLRQNIKMAEKGHDIESLNGSIQFHFAVF